ncbi:maleylpyruvate isomerase family mycothiol-dependent enzyme, partial [Streptomyces scabiei]|uniref:maleylpyruvate isomerase family mycothiol-dependent enzyme n=1 Tax=Streptomyces scabiei TaxID=1930 RepID=UPI0029B8DB31
MTDQAPAPLDLTAQARVVARLARGVRDDQLTGRTPCPEYAVRHLLGHLLGLAVAFRDAGRKELGPTTDTDPQAALPDIGPGWREALPGVLDELAVGLFSPSHSPPDPRLLPLPSSDLKKNKQKTEKK